MKKALLIFTLSIIYFSCNAQEARLDKLIVLSVPSGYEMVNNQSLSNYVKSRKNTSIVPSDSFKGLTFKSGNILFQINADTGTFETDRVEKHKLRQDNLNAEINWHKYSSELKTLNNYKVALIKTEGDDRCYYNFMAVNNDNNKIAFGIIEYDKADEAKANSFLTYVFKNLKFK